MLVRAQWILIALLSVGIVMVVYQGRKASARSLAIAEQALAESRERMSALGQGLPREPVDKIVVRVGDTLETFDRYRALDFGTMTAVQRDGEALFPEIGWVAVAGTTRQEVAELLREAYEPFYDQKILVDVIVRQGTY